MKGKSINILGDSASLRKILENRISDRMIHEITNEVDADITIYFESGEKPKIKSKNNTIIIRPWKENITPFNFKNSIELHIRDLLVVDSKGIWGPADIFEWGMDLESGNNINFEKYPIRYWTSKKDIIFLIETLIEIDDFPQLVSTVCNRKPWNSHDAFSEFEMLWRRMINSKKNKIDLIDLKVKKIPISISQIQNKPPNLKILHEFLKPINEVGWTPKTPLRISLMECLEEISKIA